jgi:F-type H+-transporting ATPase subunit gamma
MPSVRIIKRRIKSAKNIGQVTRALQMVSAVKMKRAQENALSGKPYAAELMSMLGQLTGRQETENHPFFNPVGQVNHVFVVVIGPEKGLAGSLISNLARKMFLVLDKIKKDHRGARISAISLGKKARDLVKKTGVPLLADFSGGDQISALSEFLTRAYLAHETELVIVLYQNFINTVTQMPVEVQFLPIAVNDLQTQKQANRIIIFEPTTREVLESLVEHYLIMVLRQIWLDCQAAEHSARMVAMKNASDNAKDIIKYLTLTYNQTRQTSITNEIADIVSGVTI